MNIRLIIKINNSSRKPPIKIYFIDILMPFETRRITIAINIIIIRGLKK